MRVLVLLLCLLIVPASWANPDVSAAHRTTLKLGFLPQGHCSGTAVGPHTILSAEHCFNEGVRLQFKVNGTLVEMVGNPVYDGSDHALVRIAGVTFKHWSKIAKHPPKQGESVYQIGNPGDFDDQLRFGYMTGIGVLDVMESIAEGLPVKPVRLYDLNDFHGDSGSAIFNERGQIAAVLSIGTAGMYDPQFSLAGSYDITFTKAQLRAAGVG